MILLKPILNRADELGKTVWGHLTSIGETPVTVETADGQSLELIQVYDELSLTSLLNRFAQEKAAAGDSFPGLLLDYDHFSADSEKSSEAGGWIHNMERRGDEIWVEIDPSDVGKSAILGKRFRFLSGTHGPEDVQFLGNRRVRPLRVDRVALTNDPNNKRLKPIPLSFFNRAQSGVPAAVESNHPAKTGESGDTTMDYKKVLLSLLGQPENATDAQIDAAIADRKKADESAKTEMSELKNRTKQLETDLVDSDVAAYGADVEDQEALRSSLLQNRAGTLKLLKSLKPRGSASEAGKILALNRDKAKHPDIKDTADADKQQQYADKRLALARSIMNRDKLDNWDIAWAQAGVELETPAEKK